jgi:hypothetical protein
MGQPRVAHGRGGSRGLGIQEVRAFGLHRAGDTRRGFVDAEVIGVAVEELLDQRDVCIGISGVEVDVVRV